MGKRTIYMETTTIDPEKTIAAIQKILRQHGVKKIMIDYEDEEVEAVSFVMVVDDGPVPFRMPADYYALLTLAQRGETRYLKQGDTNQARRIAWRQILRWVEAQMALVAVGMVTADQVFLPYIMLDSEGTTLYDKISQGGLKQFQLTAG